MSAHVERFLEGARLEREMTMWTPQISSIDGPRYLAVVSAIIKAIDSGQLPPGAQLPPQRELANRLGLTVGTISRAYSIVKKRHLVSGEVGRGTFVPGPRAAVNGMDTPTHSSPEAGRIDLACFRAPCANLAEPIAAVLLDLAGRANLLQLDEVSAACGLPDASRRGRDLDRHRGAECRCRVGHRHRRSAACARGNARRFGTSRYDGSYRIADLFRNEGTGERLQHLHAWRRHGFTGHATRGA